MLEVTVVRKVGYQVHQVQVQLNGVEKLTPASARAAINVAFGGGTGTVWYHDFDYETGERFNEFGYRVYEKSARKVYPETV